MRPVKLAQKAQNQLVRLFQPQPGPEEGTAILHRALTHEHHAQGQPVGPGGHADNIHVAALVQHHPLPLHGLLYRADLVA